MKKSIGSRRLADAVKTQTLFGMELERVCERYEGMHLHARNILRALHAVHGPDWADIKRPLFEMEYSDEWPKVSLYAKVQLVALYYRKGEL